jgi:hypothetical protein
MKCPNINSPEWQDLVTKHGENKAWVLFVLNNEETPTAEEVNNLMDRYYKNISPLERAQMIYNNPVKFQNRANLIIQLFYSHINNSKTKRGLNTTREVLEAIISENGNIAPIFQEIIKFINGKYKTAKEKGNTYKVAEYKMMLENFYGLLEYIQPVLAFLEGFTFNVSNFKLTEVINSIEDETGFSASETLTDEYNNGEEKTKEG